MKKLTRYIIKCKSCGKIWLTRGPKIPKLCACLKPTSSNGIYNIELKAKFYDDGSYEYKPRSSIPLPSIPERNNANGKPVKLTKDGRLRTYLGIPLKRDIVTQEDFIRHICGREKAMTEKESQ